LRGATLVGLSVFFLERVTAYEMGIKTELFGRRLRLNLALFHSLLDDIQLFQRKPTVQGVPGTAYIQNAGEARIEGGELEATALLGRMRFAGYIGITRAAYTKLQPNVQDVTLDSKFLNTPDMTASVTADLPITVGLGDINFHADYSWRDDVSFEYVRPSLASQGAYGLLNAMLSLRFDRRNLELDLWAKNLIDRRYITRAFNNDYYISATPGDPRTYGVTLAYRLAAL